MSAAAEPTKKDVNKIAEYLGCNSEELWSEVSELLLRQDIYARVDELELMWNKTQHDIKPEGSADTPVDPAYILKRRTELLKENK